MARILLSTIHQSILDPETKSEQHDQALSEASIEIGRPDYIYPLDSAHPACAGNWSPAKKLFVVATGLVLNWNTTVSSSLPSGAIDSINAAFNVNDQRQASLPVAVFLIGYVFGPTIFGPVSEQYGRKICFLSSFALFTVFTLACAFTPNWPALLFFRFFVGVAAAAPQTVIGAMYSDIYPNLRHRGRAVSALGLVSNVGPLAGPIIAGFSSITDWRWMFWISLIMAGVSWPMLLFLPETFMPVILHRQKKLEPSTEKNPGSQLSTDVPRGKGLRNQIIVMLTRPIRMFAEPMVLLTDLFLLYQYAILFLYFEAYPIIFKGIYKVNSGEAALMLLPIGVGAVIALLIFLWYDRFLAKSKEQGKAWAQLEEYRRLPLACLGGPLYAISEFWLAWTARPNIHWIVPALSGIFLGMGIDLSFMALTNYLTDAYGIYSASALASSVLSRNVATALLLPLAAYPMYTHLGTNWACSLLGFLCLILTPIPFVFIKYGPILRAKSPFCQRLEQLEREEEVLQRANRVVGDIQRQRQGQR